MITTKCNIKRSIMSYEYIQMINIIFLYTRVVIKCFKNVNREDELERAKKGVAFRSTVLLAAGRESRKERGKRIGAE